METGTAGISGLFTALRTASRRARAAAYREKLRRKFREIALKSLHDHHTVRLAWRLRRSRQSDLRDGRFGTGRRVEQPNRSSRINL
jgi:hypothetical protein